MLETLVEVDVVTELVVVDTEDDREEVDDTVGAEDDWPKPMPSSEANASDDVGSRPVLGAVIINKPFDVMLAVD